MEGRVLIRPKGFNANTITMCFLMWTGFTMDLIGAGPHWI